FYICSTSTLVGCEPSFRPVLSMLYVQPSYFALDIKCVLKTHELNSVSRVLEGDWIMSPLT
ncbi:hypothetical protein STEG23_010625, partial [Scotinomys teguina]